MAGTLRIIRAKRRRVARQAWDRHRGWFRAYQVRTLAWELVQRWRPRPLLRHRAPDLPAVIDSRSAIFRLALRRRRARRGAGSKLATR